MGTLNAARACARACAVHRLSPLHSFGLKSNNTKQPNKQAANTQTNKQTNEQTIKYTKNNTKKQKKQKGPT